MARSLAKDTSYLEQWRGKWRVTVAVPKAARSQLGTRIKRDLQTDSLTIANQLKWPIINEIRALIADTVEPGAGTDIRLVGEEFRRQRAHAASDQELTEIDAAISVTIDTLLGPVVGVEEDAVTGEPEPSYRHANVQKVSEFNAVLAGQATRIAPLHELYMAQLTVKPRTKANDERALGLIERWCLQEGKPMHLQTFDSKRVAVKFADALPAMLPNLEPVTINKYLQRLSRFWQWLERRDEVASDIWKGVKLSVPQSLHDDEERPFTEAEMLRLLNGPASQAMHDVMRIAALTGCRLDPIVCLRVGDCAGGSFLFKPQKKERKPRLCPIHSSLGEIIERRTAGKAPEDPLFPEWPGPKNSTSMRERSFKTSYEFTTYRRSVGVDEVLEGRRRSRVNFHSFRRWFITEAERADQPPHLISAVVGHKRDGMTLGLYSAGPKLDQARRVVEAVCLPKASDGSPVASES